MTNEPNALMPGQGMPPPLHPQGGPGLSCEALAQATREARRLAETIWRRRYRESAPQWKPLPDCVGLITQIDNMCAGLLEDAEQAAAAVARAVAEVESQLRAERIVFTQQRENFECATKAGIAVEQQLKAQLATARTASENAQRELEQKHNALVYQTELTEQAVASFDHWKARAESAERSANVHACNFQAATDEVLRVRAQLEDEVKLGDRLAESLDELSDLMTGVMHDGYKPDSLTLQPAKSALAAHRAAREGKGTNLPT